MRLVAYYRVSTKRQGASGLGLEAQQAAVAQYAGQTGARVIHEYVETESGKRKDRPELQRAIDHAKLARAMLVVAKLDRLARNVAFLSALMDSDIEFVRCDNPHANRLTVHILAAVAEDEARQFSERTKAALKAAKARGKKLGSARPGHWNGREHRRVAGARAASKAGVEARRERMREADRIVWPLIREHIDETYEAIAGTLNDMGLQTRRGKLWTTTAVWRVVKRMETAGVIEPAGA